MFDAIVVGARCAGAPLARLLALKGYRVALVDKAKFPSDIMSTHVIWPPGVARLKRWGLLDELVASGCPAMTQLKFDVGELALKGALPPIDGVSQAYAPRRKVLDKILVDAAVRAGAELKEGFTVEEVVMDGDRVLGVRGHTAGGASVNEAARIVIGADGMNSMVAAAVGAPEYSTRPSLTSVYYTYWSNVSTGESEFYSRPGRFMACSPTHDGLAVLIVGRPHAEFAEYRADIEGSYMRTLELAPDLAARVRAGRREERFVGTAHSPNFFRKPYGPGWALVGDAGYHRDPLTAQGICDAFAQADMLAEALDAGLSARRPMEEALADYEMQRNAAVTPMYELTCQLAALTPPPPEMQQLIAALRGKQADIDRYMGTIAGTVPIQEFFSPENLQRIMTS